MIYPGQYEHVEYPPEKVRWIDRHTATIVGVLATAIVAGVTALFVVTS